MKVDRVARALCAVLLAASAVVGCSDGGSESSTGGGPPTTEAAPSTDVPAPVGEIAALLQEDLKALGYDPGPVDGRWEPSTAAALAEFQDKVGLDESTGLDSATANTLATRLGGPGRPTVRALQTVLAELGLLGGTIDGKYGEGTEVAVEALQESGGLEKTGTYGAAEAELLRARYAAAHPEAAAFDRPVGAPRSTSPGTSPLAGSAVPSTSGATGSTSTGGEDGDDEDGDEDGGDEDDGEAGEAGEAAPPPSFVGSGPALGRLDEGPEVERLQQRLVDLGFRPGDVDGSYGSATAGAVLAFQKAEGIPRTGRVDGVTWDALAQPIGDGPQGGLVPRIEVDLGRQIVFVVLEDGVTVLNASTASGIRFDARDGQSSVAATPVGSFTVQWRSSKSTEAAVGTLYKPLFFRDGWAIHGSAIVPAYPASYGSVRVSTADQDWLLPKVLDGTPVIVYGSGPGAFSASNFPPDAQAGL